MCSLCSPLDITGISWATFKKLSWKTKGFSKVFDPKPLQNHPFPLFLTESLTLGKVPKPSRCRHISGAFRTVSPAVGQPRPFRNLLSQDTHVLLKSLLGVRRPSVSCSSPYFPGLTSTDSTSLSVLVMEIIQSFLSFFFLVIPRRRGFREALPLTLLSTCQGLSLYCS